MSTILVTGVAGFIGSHLGQKLLLQGHSVIGLDNFDPFYDKKIKLDNLSHLKGDHFNFYELDLINKDKLEKIFSENSIDVVVHLAAKAGVRPSLENPTEYIKTNVEATVSLMEAMRKGPIQKLIFASSSSIYGKSTKVPFKEDCEFDHAISPYASSKQSAELMTRLYHNLYQFDVINLRFFTVYGPRQRPDLAIHKFLKATINGTPVTVFGDGSMARDYTFVDDTVSGICGAIERVLKNSYVYETYNLGNSHPIRIDHLIQSIEKVVGKKLNIVSRPTPPGDVPITYADISKAKKYIGYNPKTSLEDGLNEFYKWIRLDT